MNHTAYDVPMTAKQFANATLSKNCLIPEIAQKGRLCRSDNRSLSDVEV